MELILTEPGQRCNSAPGRKKPASTGRPTLRSAPFSFYETEFY